MSSPLAGWLIGHVPPFNPGTYVPYSGRSLVITGPNGLGKSRLLREITSPLTPRAYRYLPVALEGYAALLRKLNETDLASATTDLAAVGLSDDELWAAAEESTPTDIDVDWFMSGLRRRGDGEERLILSPRAKGSVSELSFSVEERDFRIPISVRHVSRVLEHWTVPADVEVESLPMLTERAFRHWFDELNSVLGGRKVALAGNSLVARMPNGTSTSVLDLAIDWAERLAGRASERLERLTGFRLELALDAPGSFEWVVVSEAENVRLRDSSRAMQRWIGLAANETIREFSLMVSKRNPDPVSVDSVLHPDDVPDWVWPVGSSDAFATRDLWIAFDEPEIHLFPSEVRVLSGTLSEHAKRGRTLIVTHSLDFASSFIGSSDLMTFDGPGTYVSFSPTSDLENVLRTMAPMGPGILARTRVLYVEGYWDLQILNRLFLSRLNEANVIPAALHGVDSAEVVAASVWHRMLGSEFGVMFDALRQREVDREWRGWKERLCDGIEAGRSPSRERARLAYKLRGLAQRESRREWQAIFRLFASLISGGLEDRVVFLMHGLSDIFQLLSPRSFGIESDSWANAGYDQGKPFKVWLRASHGEDLAERETAKRAFAEFERIGCVVDPDSTKMVEAAIRRFLN